MKLNRYFLFVLISLSVPVLNIRAQIINKDQNVVAQINNDYKITFDDLHKYVIDWMYNKRYSNKSEGYKNALDAMITNQLKRFDFFAKGMEKDKDLIQYIQKYIGEELIIKYFDVLFSQNYLDEKHQQDMYHKMQKEVICRQIVLFKPENASEEKVNSIKKKAVEIQNKLDKKADFAKLVRKYSEDPVSVKENGYIQPVTWEKSLSDQVFYAIFNLNVGDIRILESNNSFLIVNVTAVNKVTVKPFENIKNEIIDNLRERYYDIFQKEFEETKTKSIDTGNVHWNKNILNQIVEWSKDPKFYSNYYKEVIHKAISENGNDTIFTHSTGAVDLKEFIRLIDNVLTLNSSGKINDENIKDYILEAVRTDILIKKAEELDLLKDILNPLTTNSVIKSKLVWMYNTAVIESQIPDTTLEALRKFYDEQKDSLYYQLDKVNIYTIIFPDKEKADEAVRKINNGTSFEKIADRVLVKTFVITRDGTYKSYLSKETPYLAEAAFKLELNEVAGPVDYYDRQIGSSRFAIIKCVGKAAHKQFAFDEVKNKIAEDFRKYYEQIISGEVAAQLRNKYRVEIHEDVLSTVISFAK